jgi:hypothetical protein
MRTTNLDETGQRPLPRHSDDPATVAKAIVAAATDSKPRVRYTAGRSARLLSAGHRILPAGVSDGQVRKTNKLPFLHSDE